MRDRIAVVVPCLNEGAAIAQTIGRVFAGASSGGREEQARPLVVAVDGGSRDDTLDVLRGLQRSHGEAALRIVELGVASRGLQLARGAQLAKDCGILLFLHADTLLPREWERAVREALESHEATLGCFRLAIADAALTWRLRVMLAAANLRARWLRLPYGDQAYFLRREAYESLGGFDAALPLMEDVDLLRRCLRLPGARLAVRSEAVETSARRWVAKGVWRNTLRNQAYMLAWHAGVSARTIYRWYYGREAPAVVKAD